MEQREDDAEKMVRSFAEAFTPLAHHFFPDGCPLISSSFSEEATTSSASTVAPPEDETIYLQQIWPETTAQVRKTVSAAAAIQAISDLQEYAASHGLMPAEMVAVARVASAVLPFGGMGPTSTTSPDVVHSPLQDGTSTHFCSLVRCLLPKNKIGNQSLVGGRDSGEQHETAILLVASRLLSACCRYRTTTIIPDYSTTSNRRWDAGDSQSRIRCCVLQFLVLVLVYFLDSKSQSNTELASLCETVVFQWALRPSTCVDALRVLWYLALPIPMYRLNQLRRFYYDSHAAAEKKSNTKVAALLAALSETLARYGVPLRATTTGTQWTDDGSWKRFPHREWKLDFSGESRRRCLLLPDSDCDNPARGAERDATTAQHDPHHPRRRRHRSGSPQNEDGPGPPFKRRKMLTGRDLQGIVQHIESSTLPSGASNSHNRHCRRIEMQTLCVATATATDILENCSLQHLVALQGAAETNDDDRFRFRDVLSFKLHDLWFSESGERDKSRLALMSSLAEFSLRAGCLPKEAATFVLQNILSTWDGDIDTETGKLLLFRVLPSVQPSSTVEDDFSTSTELSSGDATARTTPRNIFDELERFFLCGNGRLQHAIVSGTFSTLMHRWGLCHSTVVQKSDDMASVKQTVSVFRELIQWVDETVLKGFLVANETDELLRSAVIDFYDSVCDVYSMASSPFYEVEAPSPSLMYRLLLSPSALNIDRVCGIMVRYKGIFQAWKEHHVLPEDTTYASGRLDQSPGMKKIKVYNCFLWDFCSVLWRCSRPPPPNYMSARDGTDDRSSDALARTHSILYTDVRPKVQEAFYRSAAVSSSALSITHGAVFAEYASDFIKTTTRDREQQLPDTTTLFAAPDRIRGKLKVHYLDYLRDCGFCNIHLFLSTFVGSLASRKARMQKDSG